VEEKADTQFFLCLTSYLEIFFSENNELKLELNAFIVAIDTFETLKIFLDELILYVNFKKVPFQNVKTLKQGTAFKVRLWIWVACHME